VGLLNAVAAVDSGWPRGLFVCVADVRDAAIHKLHLGERAIGVHVDVEVNAGVKPRVAGKLPVALGVNSAAVGVFAVAGEQAGADVVAVGLAPDAPKLVAVVVPELACAVGQQVAVVVVCEADLANGSVVVPRALAITGRVVGVCARVVAGVVAGGLVGRDAGVRSRPHGRVVTFGFPPRPVRALASRRVPAAVEHTVAVGGVVKAMAPGVPTRVYMVTSLR